MSGPSSDLLVSQLRWDDNGLVTVVAQDYLDGEIRMVAHANEEAVHKTAETSWAHFFSRSRKALWLKGETSGNRLRVVSMRADCDGDAIIYSVIPEGPTCHTGTRSCFTRREDRDASHSPKTFSADAELQSAGPVLVRLWDALEARRQSTGDKSYTRSLLDAGASKIGDKVREEANELAVALLHESDERVVSEAADVLFHLCVGLLVRGTTPSAVMAELDRRFGTSGHEEKKKRR